ncbi:MAG: hypothetical protein K8R02_00770 [Anaerohalosphaeraceae bacterium]|nr:hypothetical protein [Anaerohalosphaeraceae bacterium]
MTDSDRKLHQNDLGWMLQDAIGLLNFQRKYSAMLLLLCAVDALAKQRFPKEKNNGDRFVNFLKEQIRQPERGQVHNIYVPESKKLLPFERILYKFLRNPLVHEGDQLELDHKTGCNVQIDWNKLSRGINVDGDNNRLILGGELVLDILLDAVSNGLKQLNAE